MREGLSPVLPPVTREPSLPPVTREPSLPYLSSGLPYLNAPHTDAIGQLDGTDDADVDWDVDWQFQIPDPAARMAATGARAPEPQEVRPPDGSGIENCEVLMAEYQVQFAALEKSGDLSDEGRAQLSARCAQLAAQLTASLEQRRQQRLQM